MEKTRQKSENVPPWEHNPSAWSQRWPVAALAVVAGAIACYMGAYQWGFMATVWDPVFGDGTANVLSSDVSKRMHHWFGIPDAIFGAFAYLGDAVFAMAGSTRRWKCRPWMVLIFGIDVIPLGIVSIILVILQGTAVGSWCFLCLTSAMISLILIVLAYDEVWSSLLYLREIWKRTGDKQLLWNTFWGHASEQAEQIAQEWMEERRVAKNR